MENTVIIIGGGPAGLMAAITAARAGAQVTVLEKMNKPGKKLLATGNGRCNLTNLDQYEYNYRGTDPHFAAYGLEQFSQSDTIRFFSELGIFTKNRNGYIYPNSDQAASVLNVLLWECEHLGVKIKGQEEIKEISKRDDKFCIQTAGWTYEAKALILAAGSQAAPVYGSDGSGYELARSQGHTIVEPLPALVPLLAKEDYFTKIAGVRAEGKAGLYLDGVLHSEERGELQLVSTGVSGIPIFQLSRFAARALQAGKEVVVKLDFMPDFKTDLLVSYLQSRIANSSYKTAGQFLIGLVNEKLSDTLLLLAGIAPSEPTAKLTGSELERIAGLLKTFPATITASGSFENAQVCSGGVNTDEINDETMESRLIPGLYFAGEIIDIDGACGGYNLQWAWSSGYVAGKSASGKDDQ